MNGQINISPLTPTTTKNDDKLSGQLIIKAQLGDDIRKMMIHNEDLTFNELVLMMERIFAGKISSSDELTIKYLDDDGDKVTLLNDSDLTVALHFHKLLRLFVLVNGKEQLNTNSTENLNQTGNLIDAQTFRTELQQIRNSVQTILDRLQLPTKQDLTHTQEKEATTTTATAGVASNAAREFDPYKNLQTQRSATPDSIRSRSSYTKRTISNEQKPPSFTSTTPTVETNHQAVEATNENKPPINFFQPAQVPTQPFFVPNNNEQQTKTSTFGPPPTSYSPIPPIPTAPSTRYNQTVAPPPLSNSGQTSTFIGQQQQPPSAPLPQQGGYYGQQQALLQGKSTASVFPPATNTSAVNAFGSQQMPVPPPSSSSPATINPSFVQPTAMPMPPTASQQPYGGFVPQNNFYNPAQAYPKAS